MDKNEYYKKLNERFAKSEMSARNYNGISNGVIMHCDDYHFNNILN